MPLRWISLFLIGWSFLFLPILSSTPEGSIDHSLIELDKIATAANTAKTASNPAPSPSIPPYSADHVSLDEAIQGWISILQKEPGFETWKNVRWDTLPLGPGTHSWIVTLRKSQLEVGYLLITATPDGKNYALSEYGTGNKPLFSMQTLYHALIQQGLIDAHISFKQFIMDPKINIEPMFNGMLQTYWRITADSQTIYLDAKSGEKLPDLGHLLVLHQKSTPVPTSLTQLTTETKSALRDSQKLTIFDPMEKMLWVQGNPQSIDRFSDLVALLKPSRASFSKSSDLTSDAQIAFSTKLYEKKAIYPFAVIGYQLWSEDKAYVALDHEGTRYVPFTSLAEIGEFY